MTLPSFNAEQSLYRTGWHYRSLPLASPIGGIRPSDDLPPWALPSGSYQDSCFQCCTNGSGMQCWCFDDSGNVVLSKLAGIDFCAGFEVFNDNGQLGCN